MSDNNLNIKLYNINEVAKLLNVSKVTIYRLTESQTLPCYKIKGCVRISHNDIMKYLEKIRRESDIRNII